MKRPIKRGPLPIGDSEFIGVWIPRSLVAQIDRAVRMLDSDRSKFLRTATREKLERTKGAAR